jgi:hypothetical protein
VAGGRLPFGRHPDARAPEPARGGRRRRGSELRAGIGIALLAGLSVAVYTTYDAYGIRATPDPFTFLAWFFFVTSVDFPLIAAWRRARMADPPDLGPLLRRGLIGALVAFVSFGSVMLATRLDKVGQAAVLRETSVVFAALIGWFFPARAREPPGRRADRADRVRGDCRGIRLRPALCAAPWPHARSTRS